MLPCLLLLAPFILARPLIANGNLGDEVKALVSTDVCGDQYPKCSPELCDNIAEDTTIHLKAGTYYIDRQIALPKGAKIIGAGVDKTIVKACGPPDENCDYSCNFCDDNSGGRRGFLLNSDTYVAKMTMVGKETGRRVMGSAALETPGCWDRGNRGNAGCKCQRDGDVCNRGKTDCKGIKNAVAEDIKVEAFGWSNNVWMPLLPDKTDGHENITFRGIVGLGTWADGANVHGGHRNILFENCHIKYAGDDCFGVWGGYARSAYQTNVTIRNNTFTWCRYPVPGGKNASFLKSCTGVARSIGIYGTGKGLAILDNILESTGATETYGQGWKQGPIAFHGSDWGNYDGFGSSTIRGNTIRRGDGDENCAEAGSQVCTIDGGFEWLVDRIHGGDNGCGSSPSPPPPPSPSKWEQHGGRNCYANHGANALAGVPYPISTNVALIDCQYACDSHAGCEGIIMPSAAKAGKGGCYLVQGLDIASCEPDSAWTLWAIQSTIQNTNLYV